MFGSVMDSSSTTFKSISVILNGSALTGKVDFIKRFPESHSSLPVSSSSPNQATGLLQRDRRHSSVEEPKI
jgi:hypothetical protein